MKTKIIKLAITSLIVFIIVVFSMSLNKNSLYDTKSLEGRKIKNIQLEHFTKDTLISDEDLKIRGPGEFFGIRQSGFLKYKIANMVTDGPILRNAREAAFSLVERDATLSHPEHNLIRDRLVNEYQEKLQKINIS